MSHFCHWWNFNWEGRPAWLSLCSNCGKRYLQIFREVSGVFQQNFNGSKTSAVLEPRTGQFSRTLASRPRTWGFQAKAKDFKMCPRGRPRGQGRPRGFHLFLQTPKKAAMVYILATIFVEFSVQIYKESHSNGKLILMSNPAIHISYNLEHFIRSSCEGNKKISDSFRLGHKWNERALL